MGEWNRVFFPAACLWGLTLWGTHSEAPAAPLHWLSCASTSLADCAYLHHSMQSTLAIAREPPRGSHRVVYKALSPSGSFCFLPSSQLLLVCISSVTDILFFSSLHLDSLAKGSLGTGPVYKDPSPFSSFLHYCLSVLYQKKKSMGQVSENRSLTAEGEKERPWQTKQQLF